MPAQNTVELLENWIFKHKSHSCSITRDDGYGASCWVVILGKGSHKVTCSETCFYGAEDVDPYWHEYEGDLWTIVVDEDCMDDWPGLDKTIIRAVECAEKFFHYD